jgi:hypothetical protein
MNEQSKPQGQGFWKEHFESWKVSGLTQQVYCTREGISYQSFVYQQSRANSKLKKAPINFIEAKIKPMATSKDSSGLQVILPNGVRIGFDGAITAALLQTIFSSAGSIRC